MLRSTPTMRVQRCIAENPSNQVVVANSPSTLAALKSSQIKTTPRP
jgi:hypothetical protein